MALYLLNISVDTPYLFQSEQTSGLIYNDQESIVEVLFEKVLSFENAIPENDASDTEQEKSFKKGFSIDKFLVPFWEQKAKISYAILRKNLISKDQTSFRKPYLEIHSPPPEV